MNREQIIKELNDKRRRDRRINTIKNLIVASLCIVAAPALYQKIFTMDHPSFGLLVLWTDVALGLWCIKDFFTK